MNDIDRDILRSSILSLAGVASVRAYRSRLYIRPRGEWWGQQAMYIDWRTDELVMVDADRNPVAVALGDQIRELLRRRLGARVEGAKP